MKQSFYLTYLIIAYVTLASHLIKASFPIQFGIPSCKIVKEIPEKKRDFAYIIPGDLKTYIYHDEASYYKGYQCAYYAITRKKAGWDCLRHYEILANGCIPYFLDLDSCPEKTMYFLPKDLIKEAMNLPGVSYLRIDHSKFDKKKYYEILTQLLDYTHNNLTTESIAQYVLDTVGYTGSGKILYLSGNIRPDYMRCMLLIGLKSLFADRIIDIQKVPHIYKGSPSITSVYGPNHFGKGFSYTQIIDDLPIDRSNIGTKIQQKQFDIIIYGSAHRGLPYHKLVKKNYTADKIIYICGEDAHLCSFFGWNNLFLREFY